MKVQWVHPHNIAECPELVLGAVAPVKLYRADEVDAEIKSLTAQVVALNECVKREHDDAMDWAAKCGEADGENTGLKVSLREAEAERDAYKQVVDRLKAALIQLPWIDTTQADRDAECPWCGGSVTFRNDDDKAEIKHETNCAKQAALCVALFGRETKGVAYAAS